MDEIKMTSSQLMEIEEEVNQLYKSILSQIAAVRIPIKRHWKKIDVPSFPIKRHWKKINPEPLPEFEHWQLLEPPDGYLIGPTTERKHIEDVERWERTWKDLNRALKHYMDKPGRIGSRSIEATQGLSKETGRSVLCELYEEYYDWPYEEFIQILLPEWLENVRAQVEAYQIDKLKELTS